MSQGEGYVADEEGDLGNGDLKRENEMQQRDKEMWQRENEM